MRALSLVAVVILIALSSCNTNKDDINPNLAIKAQVNWTADVTSINMTQVGVTGLTAQNSIHALKNGKGTISWRTSDGTEYSKTVDVGGVEPGEVDNIECEQEGDNEGCIVQLSFTGNQLIINK
jgi:hypothetical protein